MEGPNVYRLEPVVKLEVAVGRRRTWSGQRDPGRHLLVRLGARVPARDWPDGIAAIVAWVRRLRADHGEGRTGLAVHRSSDPGHWIVTFPWTGEERARLLTEAAVALAERDVSASRTARLTGGQERLLARWAERIGAARTSPPSWIRDVDRRIPVVSISGTNGKSTVTRLITHILVLAGHHVGTTTSDGVLVDERMVDPGDWTGPGGAQMILARSDIDVAVLETARGGIVLRGMGYESNDVSILTNVSSDHLDLQGIHTLPELAEVKATVCRVTRPDGWVVLNGDDPLVAAVAGRVRASVAFFARPVGGVVPAVVRRHLAGGGRAYLAEDGWISEVEGDRSTRIVEVARVPLTIGGLAGHNIANALAAAGGARGLGTTIEEVRDGLIDFRPHPAGSTCSGWAPAWSSSTSPTTRRVSRRSSTSPRGSPPGRPDGRPPSRPSSAPPATDRMTPSGASGASPPSVPSGWSSRRRGDTCVGGPRRPSSASCWPGSRPAAGSSPTSRSTSPRPPPSARSSTAAASTVGAIRRGSSS
jgi:cyanophycin synthetase